VHAVTLNCCDDISFAYVFLMQSPCLASDPMIQRAAPSGAKDAEVPVIASSNFAPEPTMINDTARPALCMGFAFWGAVSIEQAYRFQWGFWGPHNFSGVAITLFFCLLHGHCFIVEDPRSAKRFIKPSLTLDFMVALTLTLGSFVRFASGLGAPTALHSLALFAIAFGVCVRLAGLLGRLSEPS
jgi:hypothetical protein